MSLKSQRIPFILLLAGVSWSFYGCGDIAGIVDQLICDINVTSESGGDDVGINADTSAVKVAQGFSVTSDTTLTVVQLKLKKTTSGASGQITLTIQSANGSDPDGVPLTNATATLNFTAISHVSSAFYTFTFPGDVTLTANTNYFIQVIVSHSLNATNHVKWIGNSSDIYTRGSARVQDFNGFWNASVIAKDLLFKLDCQ